MTDEQINEIVQIRETIKNCYLNAIERTDADREYREGQRNIAKWLGELERYKETKYVRSQKWIDVNEKLPDEILSDVLIYSQRLDGEFYVILGKYTKSGFKDELFRPATNVTHWMPLPEPPRTPKERGGEK